jgi:hypothetical protein
MIGDQFQSVIEKTASKALPDNFTRENIGDLYKLKVGKAKQLCKQFSKMRASQEIDGIAEMLKDVHLIRLDLQKSVIDTLPKFIEKTENEVIVLKKEVEALKSIKK